MVERFIVFEGAAGERTDGFVEPGWRARSVFGPHRHSRLVPGLLIRWGFLLEVVQSHQHGPAGCLPAASFFHSRHTPGSFYLVRRTQGSSRSRTGWVRRSSRSSSAVGNRSSAPATGRSAGCAQLPRPGQGNRDGRRAGKSLALDTTDV